MHPPHSRAPVTASGLAAALGGFGQWTWPLPDVVESTGSTNADLAARAATAPEGTALLAEEQTAGRGRLNRTWDSPARAGVWMSVLLRPAVPDWSWLPLLVGVAACDAVNAVAPHLDAGLKWPNDLLCGEFKVGGVLIERHGDAAVCGIGIDVHQSQSEVDGYVAAGGSPATSLEAAGATAVDRAELAAAILLAMRRQYTLWQASGGDAERCGLADAYRARCRTLGWQVRVVRSNDELIGEASGIDTHGHLVVTTSTGPVTVAAGDVTRVRLHS